MFQHLIDPIFKKEESIPVSVAIERLIMHHRDTTPLSQDRIEALKAGMPHIKSLTIKCLAYHAVKISLQMNFASYLRLEIISASTTS